MVSLKHSWREQLGTTRYQPGEEEEMNTTEESHVVLRFSGAQISPHSYTNVQRKMEQHVEEHFRKGPILKLQTAVPSSSVLTELREGRAGPAGAVLFAPVKSISAQATPLP